MFYLKLQLFGEEQNRKKSKAAKFCENKKKTGEAKGTTGSNRTRGTSTVNRRNVKTHTKRYEQYGKGSGKKGATTKKNVKTRGAGTEVAKLRKSTEKYGKIP